MIKHLEYSVRFSATGRELEANIDFENGVTAITGPNEAGKSMVVEMIRYAFFGSEALRGMADDYELLQVQLEWRNYRIYRSNKGAKIFRDDEIIATGTKPVNVKMIQILGFGLDVFDVSCVCNQGDVERLGAMKPAERKRMVDRVIGVDRIEELQKWTGEQALLLNREIEVLSRGLVEPAAPARPADYCSAETLQGYVDEFRLVVAEADQLRGWLSHKRTAPVMPVRPEGDLAELEAQLVEIDKELAMRAHLMSIPVVEFDPNVVRAEWEKFDLWLERLEFEKNNVKPVMSRAEADAALQAWDDVEEVKRLRKVRPKGTKVKCPKCTHEFCLEHETLATIDARLAEIGETVQPTLSRDDLRSQIRRCENWEKPETRGNGARLATVEKVERPLISRQELSSASLGITTAERERRLAEIPNSGSRVIVAPKIAVLRAWQAQVEVYEREIGAYEVWVAEHAVKASRLAELEPRVAELPDLERRLREAAAYEAAFHSYLLLSSQYEADVEEVKEKQADADGWKAAKEALADLRMRIKTYLVPSLSKVASHLLSQMTGGQRSAIFVDENFDVTVDGQRLETLSGSGKACANLALRIGLGQVLTNNVMSLFIGDEIDASMDVDRAEATQDSVKNLTAQISQIFLITHKATMAAIMINL